MKKFKGIRSLDDVEKKAKELGYEPYEINYQNRYRKGDIDICLRSFGKFYVYKGGKVIADDTSEKFDNEEWYQEILEMFYIPA
ncbi:MAG: hypothetical protein KGD67_11300 [Candidatus Lokiarchaeota archaeon]|nr:hypothetical protein [Candidatus Lokiarchaeota archaeon]